MSGHVEVTRPTARGWYQVGEFLGKAFAKLIYGFSIGAGMVVALKVLY